MNTDERRLPKTDPVSEESRVNSVTEKIIGCAYEVSNVLGCGFLEKVYENALMHELHRNGLQAQQQYPMAVHYDDVIVGEYIADILVEGLVLVELKAVQNLDKIFVAQCLNYLSATHLTVCLLLNFGKPRVEVKRFVR